MKKLLLCIAAIAICASLQSCGATVQSVDDVNATSTSMFVQVERADSWMIVYHKDTKVMYAVSYGHYNLGTFTLLVNADGTPMIYGGN